MLFVFPLISIVINFACSTRLRRLQTLAGNKSNISIKEHVKDLLELLQLYQDEYPQPTRIIVEQIEAIRVSYQISV